MMETREQCLVSVMTPEEHAKASIPAGGNFLKVLIPGKWILVISSDHPAFTDLLAYSFANLSKSELKALIAMPALTHIMREYAKAELARR